MLFPYKYINHDITRLQDWIDFLFINVWCNAKEDYSLELLNGCSELKQVAEEEAWKEDPTKKAKDYITGPISVIYDLFKDELNDTQRKQIKKWYKRSRNLENVCDNKKLFNPIRRKDFEKYSRLTSGIRRKMLEFPEDAEARLTEDGGILTTFSVTSGTYATVVLREIVSSVTDSGSLAENSGPTSTDGDGEDE